MDSGRHGPIGVHTAVHAPFVNMVITRQLRRLAADPLDDQVVRRGIRTDGRQGVGQGQVVGTSKLDQAGRLIRAAPAAAGSPSRWP